MTIRALSLLTLALCSTTLVLAPACDPSTTDHELGSVEGDDSIVFRDCDPEVQVCDGVWNIFYLGLEEYGIAQLSLTQGTDPNMTIDEIYADACYRADLSIMYGDFRVLAPNLTVESDGTFGATTFYDDLTGDPCTVRDVLWVGTEWSLTVNAENSLGVLETIDAQLRIADLSWVPGKSARYRWETNYDVIYGAGASNTGSGWAAVCDEADDPLLDFHAVVYENLHVDAATGIFSSDPDTAYLACLSGIVGKAGHLWGYETETAAIAQVITNAGMAKYCGPSGLAYTTSNVPVSIWNRVPQGPSSPHQVQPTSLEVEAVWDASMEAVCVGTTRIDVGHTTGQAFDCGGGHVIPACPADMSAYENDSTTMFITYVGGN